jgi:hypothetical protein
MKQNKDLNKLLEQIAKEHLFIETLETQHRDRLGLSRRRSLVHQGRAGGCLRRR